MTQQNSNDMQILIVFFSLILGAIFAGIGALIKDHYRFKKEKLATAYAFKGEISSIVDIFKKSNYEKSLEVQIEKIGDYSKGLENVYKDIHMLQSSVVLFTIKPLLSFSFPTNDDIVFVKNKIGDKIGLLENVAENVSNFYGYLNSFMLDIENNTKMNDAYAKMISINEGLEKNIQSLRDFYKINNIPDMVKNNITHHKNMLEKLKKVLLSGQDSNNALKNFISNIKC